MMIANPLVSRDPNQLPLPYIVTHELHMVSLQDGHKAVKLFTCDSNNPTAVNEHVQRILAEHPGYKREAVYIQL